MKYEAQLFLNGDFFFFFIFLGSLPPKLPVVSIYYVYNWMHTHIKHRWYILTSIFMNMDKSDKITWSNGGRLQNEIFFIFQYSPCFKITDHLFRSAVTIAFFRSHSQGLLDRLAPASQDHHGETSQSRGWIPWSDPATLSLGATSVCIYADGWWTRPHSVTGSGYLPYPAPHPPVSQRRGGSGQSYNSHKHDRNVS